MDFEDTPKLVMVIVLVGLLIGVGAVTLGKLSTAAREDTVVGNENLTISTNTGTTSFSGVDNTTVTLYNGTADLVPAVNYTVNEDGVVTCLAGECADDNYNIAYTYSRITGATSATNNTVSAVTGIASTWLSLIITISVLSIILVLVLKSFGSRVR